MKQDKFSSIVEGTYYKDKAIFKYTSGNYTQFKDAVAHQNALRAKGFTDCFVIALKNGERIKDMVEAKKLSGQ